MDTTKQTSYTIYKTTCLFNGKIYIGKHKTEDLEDDYIGSGKHLRYAIKKHGVENFKKEILFIFDNEDDMNAKEAELVTEEFCSRDDNYNLCPGGKGGWGYIYQNRLWDTEARRKASVKNLKKGLNSSASMSVEAKSNRARKAYYTREALGKPHPFLGKHHTEEYKAKQSLIMREKQAGSKNSQFGSMWITDGVKNRKIKSVDTIPEGWYRGRK